ncbi:MAG: hypothetical protein EZS28_021339 [Streblomastix strix]|uniref:Uncharacterized protein n=1 Tax=Streblomastix strix TaxID=222440 RepID=A0A5J4VKV7_9EUKA|nr:MAG: hypothetical protein EZS28_021339 [Streblomastix strix]
MEIENNINEQQTIKPKRKYEKKECAKCGRPKKYETEEQAKSKAREQRNQFKKRQAEINKKFRQSANAIISVPSLSIANPSIFFSSSKSPSTTGKESSASHQSQALMVALFSEKLFPHTAQYAESVSPSMK